MRERRGKGRRVKKYERGFVQMKNETIVGKKSKGLNIQLADPFLYGLLKQFVKENRHHETQAETVLWRFLREDRLGVHFRRQHIIGPFIADFVCLPQRLIVELDGGYHQLPDQQINDEDRTIWLESQGFKVIRFTNEEVIGDLENTIRIIKENINGNRQ